MGRSSRVKSEPLYSSICDAVWSERRTKTNVIKVEIQEKLRFSYIYIYIYIYIYTREYILWV